MHRVTGSILCHVIFLTVLISKVDCSESNWNLIIIYGLSFAIGIQKVSDSGRQMGATEPTKSSQLIGGDGRQMEADKSQGTHQAVATC
jgi:hypothetical protein